ncbi:MAG TPA: hypothetical protein VF203_03950 [Burkholderiales bacterium]
MAILLATKTRLALVYLVNTALMVAACWRIPLSRTALFLAPIAFSAGFLLLAVSPVDAVNDAAKQLQGLVPSIRITPETAGAFSGRDILNKELLAASLQSPLTGLGDSAEILNRGVDREGGVAIDKPVARSESVLRLAVKYGWPYFGLVMLFFLSVAAAFASFPRRKQILALGIWGMCLESIFTNGGAEQFYGISAVFLFFLTVFYFQASVEKTTLRSFQMPSTSNAGNTYPSNVVAGSRAGCEPHLSGPRRWQAVPRFR